MENRPGLATTDIIKTNVTTTISTEQRIECQEHQRLLARVCRRGPLLWCKGGKHEVCIPWEQWDQIRAGLQHSTIGDSATVEYIIDQERLIGSAPTEKLEG